MIAKYRQQLKDSAYTAIVVGTLLVFINHLQAIISFTFTSIDLLHWSLNFVVPFMVSLYSRVSALKKAERSPKNY